MITVSLATVLLMLTVIGLIGIAFIARGAYLCVQHRGSIEGVLLFGCGVFICLMAAMLTNVVRS